MTSGVFPPRNLGLAEQWGRVTENKIIQGEQDLLLLGQTLDNLGRATSSQSDLLSKQLASLDRAFSRMESQQEQLSAQQDQLASQQDQIFDLIDAIPVSQAFGGSASNFNIPNGTSTRITISVPVPSGKTRANVFVYGQALFSAVGIPNAYVAAWRSQIDGTYGDFGNTVPLNMDGKSVTFAQSRSFSVSGKSSFNILARTTAGQAHSRVAENSADLHAIVTFS